MPAGEPRPGPWDRYRTYSGGVPSNLVIEPPFGYQGCRGSWQCPDCYVQFVCDSSRAGQRSGNTRYINGPCACGMSRCDECGYDYWAKVSISGPQTEWDDVYKGLGEYFLPPYAVAVADADFDPQAIVDDLNKLVSAREEWALNAYRGKPGPGGMENPGLTGLNCWLQFKAGALIGVKYDDDGLPVEFCLVPEFVGCV